MTAVDRWILPDGIEEVLPPEAGRIETIRRNLLDTFHTWGYDLVIPPLAEYLDSLLTGVGHDLDLLTFKLTDQLSGKLMGLSADSTQQVARMDAHSIQKPGVARYCYSCPVLHTRPASIHVNRSPIQIGAELYGYRAVECDIEIVSLMIACLQSVGVKDITLDLGHVGIYRALVENMALPKSLQAELYGILRSRSLPDLELFIQQNKTDYAQLDKVSLLADLVGDETVLSLAADQLKELGEAVNGPISRLTSVAEAIKANFPEIQLHFDLSELKDLNYHTGLVFSAFTSGAGTALAKGGRYDSTGEVFGRSRPATGFSADLKVLAKLISGEQEQKTQRILAPAISDDSDLNSKIADLRSQGIAVIKSFGLEHDTPENHECSHVLESENGSWTVKPA